MTLNIYMRIQAIVVQDELRNGLLPHIVKWLYLMLNVIIFDMYDPMKHIDKLMKVKIEAY
jgi:hypothetical protein